jgi:hypothetical protein
MTGSKHWTEKELTLLIRKYETTPIEEMMKLLPGRSKNAIQWKASEIGCIIRDGKIRKAEYKMEINFTKEQADFLNKKRNHSRIVREALDLYMKRNDI